VPICYLAGRHLGANNRPSRRAGWCGAYTRVRATDRECLRRPDTSRTVCIRVIYTSVLYICTCVLYIYTCRNVTCTHDYMCLHVDSYTYIYVIHTYIYECIIYIYVWECYVYTRLYVFTCGFLHLHICNTHVYIRVYNIYIRVGMLVVYTITLSTTRTWSLQAIMILCSHVPNLSPLLQTRPIKETVFCKRDL